MENCKKEFIEHTKEKDILCASIEYGKAYWDEDAKKHSVLKVGFTETDFNLFLKSLNYEYDSGYGGQEVLGTIWYKDGTWSERGEYDGSEWWEYKSCPVVPDNLK